MHTRSKLKLKVSNIILQNVAVEHRKSMENYMANKICSDDRNTATLVAIFKQLNL